MRRTLRLVLALCALAALAAPGRARSRAHVGRLPRRPSFRWDADRTSLVQSSADDGASIMRLLVQWNLVAPRAAGYRVGPIRPRVQVRRPGRGAARGAAGRHGGHAHDLGHAALGERRQDQPHAEARLRPHRFRARDLVPLLGALRRLPVRALLVGLERARTSPASSHPSSPRAASRSRRRTTRGCTRPRYTGIKAGNPRALRSRSARRRHAEATSPKGLRPDHSPGRFAELVAKANPRLKFDAWSHHPYPFSPNSPPSQVVRWPNVTLASLPRFDDGAQALVQAEDRSDLDHGVRPP